MLLEAWNAATEEFSEAWPSTTVHQIQGARITLSVSYNQKDWEPYKNGPLSMLCMA